MVNRGVEITLSGEIIRQKDFSWNASLLYAFNRNKVKHISVQPSLWDSRISMPTSYPMVGKPLYGIYAYKWAGLNENGDPQVYDAEIMSLQVLHVIIMHWFIVVRQFLYIMLR